MDDWYQQHAPALLAGKAGAKPTFADSEVLTLSVAQHWLGVPDEREFLRLVRNNWLPLFPRLVSQGQFNRRARNLCWLMNRMRQHVIERMGVAHSSCPPEFLLIDGIPVKVRHWLGLAGRGQQHAAAGLPDLRGDEDTLPAHEHLPVDASTQGAARSC